MMFVFDCMAVTEGHDSGGYSWYLIKVASLRLGSAGSDPYSEHLSTSNMDINQQRESFVYVKRMN